MLEKAYQAKELLSGNDATLVLMRDLAVDIALPPRGAVVYKLSC